MSFFSSLKRLFFTTESVAKSAVDKAKEAGKDKVSEISESLEKAIDSTQSMGEQVLEKSSDAAKMAWDITKETAEKVESMAKNTFDNITGNVDTVTTSLRDSEDLVIDPTSDLSSDPLDISSHSDKMTVNTESDIVDSSFDATKTTTEKVTDLGKESLEKVKDFAENTLDKLGKNEWVLKASEIAEDVGSKVLETGEVLMEKAAQVSENLEEKIIDSSDKTWEKLSDVKDSLVVKAKEVSDKMQEKFDATLEKAEAYIAEENAKPKQEFSDKDLTTGPDLLSGTDDFFTKASQYADGHHGVFSEGKIIVKDKIEDIKKEASKIAGQDDLDGDGNELIDDAQIVD